jgi:hypothetical protein
MTAIIEGWSDAERARTKLSARSESTRILERLVVLVDSDWSTKSDIQPEERRRQRRGPNELISSGIVLLLTFLLIAVWAVSVGQ